MRVTELHLKNFRSFGKIEQSIKFDRKKQVTVILGNNGFGKSSIVDALATSISVFVASFPGKSIKNFTKSDVHITKESRPADFLEVTAYIKFDGRDDDIKVTRTLRGYGRGKLPEQNLKDLKNCAEQLTQSILSKTENVILPIFAYYGTGRGFFEMPQRKRNFKQNIERWDCYDGCLQPAANFKKFIENYDLLEDEERREAKARRDFDYELPKLKAIRDAIESFVPGKFSDPRIEMHPLRFVMNEKIGDETREIRLEQMSDGYKIMTMMVADIATRMVEANPDMPDPLNSPGVVLIDEIDLHLHPKWQRDVIDQLCRTFKKVQFIVTTHSPVVLLGGAEKVQVVLLEDGNIRQDVATNLKDLSINQLLLGEVFGLDSIRSHYWQKKLKEQDDLLAKDNLTDEEKSTLDKLNKEVKQISFSDSADSQRINSLIEQIAQKVGVEL